MLYIWAAAEYNETIEDRYSGIDAKYLSSKAGIIDALINSLPEERSYKSQSIKRTAAIIVKENAYHSNAQKNLLPLLIEMEVLLENEHNEYSINPYILHYSETHTGIDNSSEREIIIQPNYEITVKSWVPMDLGIIIPQIADIKKYDHYPCFEITKHSILRGFRLGLKKDEILRELETLNHQILPQNIVFSLNRWQEEKNSINLYKGIVLTVDEERSHFIEHTDFINIWVRKKIAPCVYLLDPEEKEQWQEALLRVGFDYSPDIEDAGIKAWKPLSENIFQEAEIIPPIIFPDKRKKMRDDVIDKKEIQKTLMEKLGMLYPTGKEHDELTARINKKLIFFPSQLKKGIGGREKTEVKGLDYLGKVRLIEQALKSGTDLLEVIERTQTGAPRKVLITPVNLEKNGNNLVLHGKILPEETDAIIQVQKISLLRKLKSSLFAP